MHGRRDNSPKPSVLMVASGNTKNGVIATTSFVKSQADSLRVAQCDVFLTIVDDRTSIRGILQNAQRIKSEISTFKPGLIHAQYGSVTAAVANIVKGSLPLIVSFCGDDLLGTPEAGLRWRVREAGARLLGLWAAQCAAAIIIKSNNLCQALPADMRLKATVLPNGVDTSLFRPMAQDECRDKLGWDKRSKIVLFNGSTESNQSSKNPALARAAMDILARTVPGVSLHVLGDVSHTAMPLILNAADCLLVTSLHEGSPNIVKEAMACNLPVVSVRCGDVAERLRMTRPGNVCSYDAHALAASVHDVLVSPIRSNGHEQLIVQGLTTAQVAARLIQLYEQIHDHRWSITSRAA